MRSLVPSTRSLLDFVALMRAVLVARRGREWKSAENGEEFKKM